MEIYIYILINNQPQGPYTRELIQKYLKSGAFKATDLAAYAGSSDWKPLSTMVQSWNVGSAQVRSMSPTKRKPVAIIISAAVALLMIAGGFVFWRTSHKAPVSGVTINRRDLPKSLADLNAWYVEPPEGKNAAALFAKGFEQFQITDADQKSKDLPIIGDGSWPQPGTPLSAREKASMAAFVQRNDAAWAALEQGVAFEQARYPVDLNHGTDALLPHLAKVKKTAQIAQLKAALHAEDNQPKAAADTLLISLAVAESLKDEPILISQMVRIADHAIGVATLEQMMNSVALSADDLERLSAAFGKLESSQARGEGLTRAFVGERVLVLSLFDLPSDKLRDAIKADRTQNQTDATIAKMMENLPAQRAFAEDILNHALEIRAQPFPERMQMDQYFPARADEARTRGYLLCHLLFSGFGKPVEREAKDLANLRLAETAIALERYRRANGGYPDSLSMLVPKFMPEIPVDPAKGQEMQYQKSGEGYDLTSSAINSPKPLSFKIATPPKAVL